MFDPVGSVLETGLKPVGYGLNTVTGPVTDIVGGVTRPTVGAGIEAGKEKVGAADQKRQEEMKLKERIGGKEETGDNPLGL